ncbi:hypothetical protein Droror1_Dr00011353 [Drosera rotundifolia]
MLQCLCVPLCQDVKKVYDYLFLQCCFSFGNYVVCMYICYVGWRLARSSCTFGRFLSYTKTLRLARGEYLKKVKLTILFSAVGECGSRRLYLYLKIKLLDIVRFNTILQYRLKTWWLEYANDVL